MTRIFIIGGTGSGKTTLGRRLARQLNIPFYEMDLVGWENGAGAERPMEVRLRDVHEIAMQQDWVVEGWFRPWTDELQQEANQIVWLDLPWSIVRWRIITRHMRASLAGTNKHRGLLKLYRFLKYARIFYTSTPHTQPKQETRLVIAKELQPYLSKVVHCRKPADVDAFLAQLTAQN